MGWTLHYGEALDVMAGMDDASVDAVCTDPPYALAFMGKHWDSDVPTVALWKEALRICKPGAHLLAFGGTRTYHRMTVAIEDAGFEIRDCLAWHYGSGFPKSHNLDGEWEGWGTALKPSWEPIVLARKPLSGTVAGNVEVHGTGALNVDGCRVGAAGGPASRGEPNRLNKVYGDGMGGLESVPLDAGRWPPNTLLSHSACCGDECGECCPVREMDRQSGLSTTPASVTRGPSRGTAAGYTPSKGEIQRHACHGDSGGASRFFPRFRYVPKASSGERNEGLGGLSMPRDLGVGDNAADSGRGSLSKPRENHHPTVKPVALMRWLCRLITPPGGTVLDPFAGSGTTLIAATREGFNAIGIEREAEYIEIARRRVEEDAPLFNRANAARRGEGS